MTPDLKHVYLLAASEHFELYRTGEMATPSACTDAELADGVAAWVGETGCADAGPFDRQAYYEAWHEASAKARWAGVLKSAALPDEE